MSDPNGRRAKPVLATDNGTEVIGIAQQLAPELESRLIDALGESRWRRLRNDLQTIHELFVHGDPGKGRSRAWPSVTIPLLTWLRSRS
jgi:hypothetical protein